MVPISFISSLSGFHHPYILLCGQEYLLPCTIQSSTAATDIFRANVKMKHHRRKYNHPLNATIGIV
jgi:hypothetical protein